MISGDDSRGITILKQFLSTHFHMKNFDHLRYFLRIEVTRLSQRKYLTNLLTKSVMLGSKPVATPMDLVAQFDQNLGDTLENLDRYRRLIRKIIYLTVTKSDITFVVGVLSQYMQTPHQLHWGVACRVLRYFKGAPGRCLF